MLLIWVNFFVELPSTKYVATVQGLPINPIRGSESLSSVLIFLIVSFT